MTTPLAAEVQCLELGTHACLLYDSREDQLEAILPFIQQGLRLGHRCLYVADDLTAADVVASLSARGADVLGSVRTGALMVHTKRETYLREGHFDPDAMLAFVETAIDDAVASGYPVFRGTGEMTWALGPEPGTHRLLEYESRLTGLIAPKPAMILCQYNRARFPPEIIRGVLQTHPVAIVGSHVYDNPFYAQPGLVPRRLSPAEEVEWMLAELESMLSDGTLHV